MVSPVSTKSDLLYVEQLNEWYEDHAPEESILRFRRDPEALIEYIVNVYRELCGTFIFHDIQDDPKVFTKNLKDLRNNDPQITKMFTLNINLHQKFGFHGNQIQRLGSLPRMILRVTGLI